MPTIDRWMKPPLASPNCAYVKLLNGDRKYLRGDLPGALADYQEAARREPNLAEAHFNMARVHDRQDNPDSALPEYQLAASLSPGEAMRLAAILPNPDEWHAAHPGPYVAARSGTLVSRAAEVARDGLDRCVRN